MPLFLGFPTFCDFGPNFTHVVVRDWSLITGRGGGYTMGGGAR